MNVHRNQDIRFKLQEGYNLKKSFLLGIDLGTGGCKITIIDYFGNVIAESTYEYKTYYPKPFHSEQNPDNWFSSMVECLKNISEEKGINLSYIKAVSIDASTHNAVLLDKNMDIIRPTIMWTDQRSVEEVSYLKKKIGKKIFEIGYNNVAPTWTLPQMLWLRNNEPENYKKISKIMFVKDYVRYLLTGDWKTDYIDAQGTLMFDVAKSRWSEEICNFIDFPISALPPLCKPTDIAGKIIKEVAEQTGLTTGTPVICGTSDSAVEDYGAGAIKPGQCIIKLATAGNVNVMTDIPHPNPLTLTYSHVVPGVWYTVAATNTAAIAMRWFRDNFCYQEIEESKVGGKNVYKIMGKLAESVPPGSEGLIFHPYLTGERSPYWDADLRASFTGARITHEKAYFLRSLMEGVAYSLRDCYRVIEDMGLKVTEYIIIGGGSRSDLWSQIVCDLFGKDVVKPLVSDASYGSALIAGVGIGVYSDLADAVNKCNKFEKLYKPNSANHNRYKDLFKIYLDIHNSLEGIYKKLNKVI